jgi:hypothetical protein
MAGTDGDSDSGWLSFVAWVAAVARAVVCVAAVDSILVTVAVFVAAVECVAAVVSVL